MDIVYNGIAKFSFSMYNETIRLYQFVHEVDLLLHKLAKRYYITYILLHFCNICNLFRNKRFIFQKHFDTQEGKTRPASARIRVYIHPPILYVTTSVNFYLL